MALKAMMLKRDLERKQAELDALMAVDFKAREKELEAAIAEVQTEDEKSLCNDNIDKFEADKAENESKASTIRAEIEQLEKDLAEEEARINNATVEEATEQVEERGAVMPDMTAEMQERAAFVNYVRGLETRDDYNMIQGNNGGVIPKTIAKQIITEVAEICPIFEKSTHYNVKGTLEVPYYPASADHVINCAYANEMSALTASSGDFGTVEMTGFVAGALAKISKKLINNTDIDVVPFIVDQMAEAFKAFYEKELINGTNNKVTGMLAGITQTLTGAAKSSVTADELITLQSKVPTAYQGNSCWIMAPATFNLVRKLKDGDNRYLLNNDIRNEFGYSLLGKPVYISDNMPALGTASNKAIVYGDLTGLGVKLTEDLEIQVLQEKFIDVHAVGVIGWTEFDAKVVNAQKLAAFVCGSSDPQ